MMLKDVIIKKCVYEKGEGFLCPNILSSVQLTIIEVQSVPLDVFYPGFQKNIGLQQDYILNSGCGMEWLIIDYCLMKMRPGEMSAFTVKPAVFNNKDIIDDVSVILHLHCMERYKNTWKLDISEKHAIAERAKASGTDLIKEKDYTLAAEKYSFALKMLISDGCRGVIEDNHVERCDAIKMNLSLCYMKLGHPEYVIIHCSDVLNHIDNKKVDNHEDPHFLIKALYRRAWAYCEINEYEKCQADLERILLSSVKNNEALELRKRLSAKIKNSNDVMSNNLQKMFG